MSHINEVRFFSIIRLFAKTTLSEIKPNVSSFLLCLVENIFYKDQIQVIVNIEKARIQIIPSNSFRMQNIEAEHQPLNKTVKRSVWNNCPMSLYCETIKVGRWTRKT